ncbi:MAG: tetratricopeptide repeat protein [Chthoniobacterales bacterium]
MKWFLAELKRRKVFRVAVAYAVAVWLLVQIATQVFPFFDIPSWAVRLVIVLLAIGFPIALVLSWIFDLTPRGIRRTAELEGEVKLEARSPGAVPEKSIAVLPFENLSEDKQNDYFAAGVHDDVLSNLAKVSDLKVISRTSVQQFKSSARNLREIGRALGVAHILEGTARRAGNRVRVNAQLIDARTDAHVWSETFDREITDLFALQSELAERITHALRANLSPAERTNLHTHPTRDVMAYELFLRARELFHWAGSGDSHDSGAQALRLINEAIERDPNFALAYALGSRLHAELFWFGYDKRVSRLERAKAAADTALKLQPDLGEAHLATAFYHFYGFRHYDLARTHIIAAMRALPNDAEVLNTAGALDRRQGNWKETVANLEKARQLDPRNLSVFWNLLETYLALHRYAEAEEAVAAALQVSSSAHLFALARAALPLFQRGDTAPLRLALSRIPPDFDPGGAVTVIRVRVALMDRDFELAARTLADCSREMLNDLGLAGTAGAIDDYTVPKSWYAALIARGQGNDIAARAALDSAKASLTNDLAQSPDHAKSVAMLALVYAELEQAADAVQHADRAVELLPIARDAFDGPFIATARAAVLARIGERDRAIGELESLIGIPNGPTPGTLRIEPQWETLRGDARFEKIAALTPG